ncbi:SufB/SufD family protein [Stakelama marina]|uniref:SufD family Fe-S cluster assembly protein n=1 Tax=Stakelama marina TaxID=2826939 RepID=A0A8T4IDL4_9SPHN|nr:SufD family Fe-S cluster assembly protein [Stakelama marina]MBR0552603.1 SufD family Fe-S cluster assembly protein [Stakelama marina]
MTDTLDLPTKRQEEWRWSDMAALEAAAQSPAGEAPDADGWFIDGLDGPRLVFVDGEYQAGRSDAGPVTLEQLSADTDHPLGRRAAGAGWVLRVGEGGAKTCIQIVHLGSGGANHVPARIELAADATASIVETYAGTGWANRLTQIDLARGARLMRSVRLLQSGGFVSLRDEAEIGEAASLVSIVLGAGDMGSRIDGNLRLTGDGAFAEMGGALLTRDSQSQEAAVVVHHAKPEGSSRQIWRAVAADTSTASLAARVEVARDAQHTDGEQSLRGLLLKRSATVNLKPELEIFADDVKCAHGATVGELDKRALFYLESRGVAPARAQALLTRAFVADALDRIGEEAVREAFADNADRWLESAL